MSTVLISWCYRDVAVKQRVAQLQQEDNADEKSVQLAELANFELACKTPVWRGTALSEKILAVGVTIIHPDGRVHARSFELSRKIWGTTSELPTREAFNWLINALKIKCPSSAVEWDGHTFVGLNGLSAFLEDWALQSAAENAPLPWAFWQKRTHEMPEDSKLREVVETWKVNEPDFPDWLGCGVSLAADRTVLMRVAFCLGVDGFQPKTPSN